MAAGFEDIVEANDVALDIDIGVIDAIAHTGLGGEVHHDVEAVLGEQLIYQCLIGDATLHKLIIDSWQLIIKGFQLTEAVFL